LAGEGAFEIIALAAGLLFCFSLMCIAVTMFPTRVRVVTCIEAVSFGPLLAVGSAIFSCGIALHIVFLDVSSRFRSPSFVMGQRPDTVVLQRRHTTGVPPSGHFRCTNPVVKPNRNAQYALMTAVAAVVGLLLLRAPFTAVSLTADFFSNRYTFTYLFAAVALTFLGLGYVLGRQSDRLRRLSTIDGLTGLSNRRAFDDRLRKEWYRAERYGSSLALLMIDIDGLKEVNDASGHAAGDNVLRITAIAIRESLRGSDTGARWGGDEFAIIAPETSREAAELLGRRLLVRLKNSGGPGPMVSASVGIAVFEPTPGPAPNLEWLIQRADAALYIAKTTGRDQVKVA